MHGLEMKSIPSQRDTRIDVFRALALLTIFINHVPGTVFENFTHKNFGFSDAAEAFVMISGIAMGLAYGMKFQPGGQLLVAVKLWRRAGVLYVTHIMTTLATLGIFSAAALYLARPDLLKLINIDSIINDTPAAAVGIVTLGHQVGYNNILSMYAAVLVLMPLFLLLGRHSLKLMVAASCLLWLVAGIWQIAPRNFPTSGVWFLNPLSWQFLFVIGMAGMMHVRRGGQILFKWPMALGAAFYLIGALLWVKIPLWGIETASGLPTVLTGFDKTFLSASRLLHILAITYLVVSIPALSNLARTGAEHPLALMGRHALPVFIAGTLLAMAAQVIKTVSSGGFAMDSVIIATGIALQFALAYYLEWLSVLKSGRGSAHPASSVGVLKPA
nr:OpgC domain-containing protein [Mesorhizobium sp. NBSH29]